MHAENRPQITQQRRLAGRWSRCGQRLREGGPHAVRYVLDDQTQQGRQWLRASSNGADPTRTIGTPESCSALSTTTSVDGSTPSAEGRQQLKTLATNPSAILRGPRGGGLRDDVPDLNSNFHVQNDTQMTSRIGNDIRNWNRQTGKQEEGVSVLIFDVMR